MLEKTKVVFRVCQGRKCLINGLSNLKTLVLQFTWCYREKKKGADAKKVTQEPVRFEDMLRNDKVNFYNAKSTPGAGTLQSGGLDTAKKSINKENSGIQGSSTPIRTHSANARPSPFGSALNAQKTRSIYGETSNMKTPKSKDQSVGARVNTNYGSRSPLSQLKSNLASRSPFSKDLSQKNLPGDTRHSNPLGPVSTNNFSGARLQSTSAHKTFSGPVMSRLEQARQARKGSPITQGIYSLIYREILMPSLLFSKQLKAWRN